MHRLPQSMCLGLLLSVGSAYAGETPEGPLEPTEVQTRPAERSDNKAKAPAGPAKTAPGTKKIQLAAPQGPAKPAAATNQGPPQSAASSGSGKGDTKPVSIKLAPSASEIETERKTVPPAKPPPNKDPRDATPKQDPRWPTHVDYTRGPGSTVGSGTSGDRKATVQDASGPQQGVIRNRW